MVYASTFRKETFSFLIYHRNMPFHLEYTKAYGIPSNSIFGRETDAENIPYVEKNIPYVEKNIPKDIWYTGYTI